MKEKERGLKELSFHTCPFSEETNALPVPTFSLSTDFPLYFIAWNWVTGHLEGQGRPGKRESGRGTQDHQ